MRGIIYVTRSEKRYIGIIYVTRSEKRYISVQKLKIKILASKESAKLALAIVALVAASVFAT